MFICLSSSVKPVFVSYVGTTLRDAEWGCSKDKGGGKCSHVDMALENCVFQTEVGTREEGEGEEEVASEVGEDDAHERGTC